MKVVPSNRLICLSSIVNLYIFSLQIVCFGCLDFSPVVCFGCLNFSQNISFDLFTKCWSLLFEIVVLFVYIYIFPEHCQNIGLLFVFFTKCWAAREICRARPSAEEHCQVEEHQFVFQSVGTDIFLVFSFFDSLWLNWVPFSLIHNSQLV